MAVAKLRFITEEEYLADEELALEKHEYLAGQVFAMTGGTPEHALIASNIGAELRPIARPPCNVYSSDLRLRVTATGLNTYPDVTVICGEVQKTDQRPPAATNPQIIVEVLSESTHKYDRGEKWRHYQQIDSLTDYILVWLDRPRVEHYTRQSRDTWTYRLVEGLDAQVTLATLGGEIFLSGVYRGLNFNGEMPLH